MTTGPFTLGLLAAARAEFTTQVLPHLAPEQRYVGEMLRRSLDVLYTEATTTVLPEAALSEAGFGTAAELAAALRAREVQDDSVLRRALRAYVKRKLAISNPRVLARSKGRV